jgi:lysophospholipase L1-like esterase
VGGHYRNTGTLQGFDKEIKVAQDFGLKSAIVNSAFLLALVSIPFCSSHLADHGISGRIQEIVAQMRGRDSYFDKGGNGYYEDLMENTDTLSRQTAIEKLSIGERARNAVRRNQLYLYHGGFLMFEGKPNMNLPNTVEGPIRTNSYGFFDYEHTLEKPMGVRRIAFFGDSITKGSQIDMDARFSTLLEQKLNAQKEGRVEILNFAVPAYHSTQILDVALEKAPPFHPDVYVVVLTELTANSLWEDHIKRLMEVDGDLKYDFLKKAVRESGLQKGDSTEVSLWKMEPYRETLTRDILLRMKASAEQHSAQFVIALVPAAEEKEKNAFYSRELLSYVQGLDVPVINLMDTFQGMNVESLRTNWYDPHPNELAHRLIAENFYSKLRQNPETWAAIMGDHQQTVTLDKKSIADFNSSKTY